MSLVLAHGVFDLLHSGHVEHLRQAREFGDILIVSLVPDEFVKKAVLLNKQEVRETMLRAVRYVHAVFLCGAAGPEILLRTLKPDIYVRGSEYIEEDKPEYEVVKRLGISVAFTKPIPTHTSELIARIKAL